MDNRQQRGRGGGGRGGYQKRGAGRGRGAYSGDGGGRVESDGGYNSGRGGYRRDGRGRGRGDSRGGGSCQGGYRGDHGSEGGNDLVGAVQRIEINRPTERIDMAVAKEIVRTRPENLKSKGGTSGQAKMMTANYFALNRPHNWEIYQYRVDFQPDIDSTKLKKGVLKRHNELLGANIFDGSMLFTTKKLNTDPQEFITTLDSGEVIRVIIKYCSSVRMNDQRSIQIFNLILRRAMDGLNLSLVGRNYYDSNARISIKNKRPEHNLELWPGYITSIRQHEHDILLSAGIGFKVLRTDNIYQMMSGFKNKRDMQKAVIGQCIITDYNNKTYKIDGINFAENPEGKFQHKDKEISYIEYYKTRYGITIRDPKQPLIISRAKAREIRGGAPPDVKLIPELCRLTGLTDEMRRDFLLMRDIANYTRNDSKNYQNNLRGFNLSFRNSVQSMKVLNDFGLGLSQTLVQVPARVLPNDSVRFGNDAWVKANDNADWTVAFRNNQLFSKANIQNWTVIIPHERTKKFVMDFIQQLNTVCRTLGINFGQPDFHILSNHRAETYGRAIEEISSRDPQMIMAVLPNDNADRYIVIKRKCCVDRAIPSQGILERTITPRGGNPRGLLSIATKVAVQMNCKIGSVPWKMDILLPGVMVIGFDVYHKPRDRSRSCGAFVATMDQQVSDMYYSTICPHKNGEEVSNTFGKMTREAIECYVSIHKELPKMILIYRDGVGEGQFDYVVEHEVNAVKLVLDDLYGPHNAKMAFIVVSKRINTRVFDGDRNPKAGTVIDDVITMPDQYDFYLVSQNVNQGTATPTHYSVIYDNSGLTPDTLQVFTHKMCHLYYNWSGTVRVPAVCQYAHKLALLAGQYLQAEPNSGLNRKLYYL